PIVVIIDDGSTDGTKDWIEENYPDIKIIRGNGDLWWSGGINYGARYAIEEQNVEFLLLWNNDILANKDYFIKLDELIPNLGNDTILGSKIYYLEPLNKIWSLGGYFNPQNGKKYMIGYEELENKTYTSPIEVDWLPGMGTIVPSEIVREIGYWDDRYFPQYHGDSDFTYRAKVAGFKIIVNPELIIRNDNTNTGLIHGGSIKKLLLM
ncbi:MAG: glycosyltransferase family 2 protein, partial [Bacteroidales bacterium]